MFPVGEAAVIGLPDKSGNEIIKAFLSPAEGKTISLEKVSRIVAANISPIKVPAEYAVREELPKTLNGDIIRRILREEELAKRK